MKAGLQSGPLLVTCLEGASSRVARCFSTECRSDAGVNGAPTDARISSGPGVMPVTAEALGLRRNERQVSRRKRVDCVTQR
jgi:hypothetical protein